MPRSREQERAKRAANIAAGLRGDGKPRKPREHRPLRDHVAEVDYLMIVGLDIEGIASDMNLTPGSLLRALQRKGRYDLIARLDPERKYRGTSGR